MNDVVLTCLAGSTVVFMAANAALKTYVAKGGPWVLVGALFCLGNWLMVRVMRGNGLGIALGVVSALMIVWPHAGGV